MGVTAKEGTLKKNGRYILPARYVLTFLTFWGMCLIFGHRVCLNVALVAMVNSSAEGSLVALEKQVPDDRNNYCPDNRVETNVTVISKMGTYAWTPSVQGIILGSYFYGYVVAQVVGGRLADVIGAKRLFGYAVLLSSILTILTPTISALHSMYTVALRVVLGLVHGMNYPCVYTLFARWAPVHERSTLLSICVIGTHFGVVLSMPLTGYLCENGFAGGWPSAFYVLGGFGFLLYAFWSFLVFETPSDHPRISQVEINHILMGNSSVSKTQKKSSVPWGKIAASPAIWAVTLAKFCGAWSFICFQSKLPVYLDEVLGLTIQQNGLVNAMLFGALCISIVLSGKASDLIRKKECVNITTLRKSFETVALLGPAACMALIPLFKCKVYSVVALLTSSMALFGLCGGGDVSVIVDMAPDFAGRIFGVSNAIASIPGILAPMVSGYFLEGNKGDAQQWNYIFYISVAMYMIGASVFLVFGSAEIQSWGTIHSVQEQELEKHRDRTQSTLEHNLSFVVPVILSLGNDGKEKSDKETHHDKF